MINEPLMEAYVGSHDLFINIGAPPCLWNGWTYTLLYNNRQCPVQLWEMEER